MSRSKVCVLVMLVLAAALSVTGCGAKSAKTTAGGTKSIVLRVLVDRVPHGVADSLVKGQPVRLRTTGAVLGTIESVEVTADPTAFPDSRGMLIESPSPLADQIVLTLKGTAVVSESGFRVGGGNIYVSGDDEFVTPTTILRGSIVSMRTAP